MQEVHWMLCLYGAARKAGHQIALQLLERGREHQCQRPPVSFHTAQHLSGGSRPPDESPDLLSAPLQQTWLPLGDLELDPKFIFSREAQAFSRKVHRDPFADDDRSDITVSGGLEAQHRQAIQDPSECLVSLENPHPPSFNASIPGEHLVTMVENEGRQVGNDDTKDTIRSAWASSLGSREAPGPVRLQECIVCTESFHPSRIVRTICDHNYCNGCIQKHFEGATKNESRFPPKCCSRPIPLDLVKSHLSLALILLFKEKLVEFSTPNRTYCSREACNAFIHPDCVKEDIATCQKCYQRTCTNCKRKGHEGDCHEDDADKFLVKTASEKGWQRCFKCRRIVERLSGCNHMT
jgi:hypothetical protein